MNHILYEWNLNYMLLPNCYVYYQTLKVFAVSLTNNQSEHYFVNYFPNRLIRPEVRSPHSVRLILIW